MAIVMWMLMHILVIMMLMMIFPVLSPLCNLPSNGLRGSAEKIRATPNQLISLLTKWGNLAESLGPRHNLE
eukprot:7584376-Karenia_brevis.AAC.1